MKKPNLPIACILFGAVFFSCSQQKQTDNWTSLFNGQDLSGWDTYIGPLYSAEVGDFDGERIGLNNDPAGVFTVVQEDGQPALKISGEQFGGISTVESFENYHLQLQFKWGEKKYAPRDSAKRDSGLLYHAGGPHGVDWFFWMKSQEFQIQEGDCGDYWGLGSDVKIRAKMNADSTYTYDPKSDPVAFGANSAQRNAKKYPDAEKPSGEWNTLDLYTVGTTSTHVVNGVLTMILEDSSQPVDGVASPLTKGKIQIQSEGAEVYYRNIRMEPIDTIPAEILGGK